MKRGSLCFHCFCLVSFNHQHIEMMLRSFPEISICLRANRLAEMKR